MSEETTSATPALASFTHVLVCLDGSASAEAALPLAAHLARLDESRMTLLRVLDARSESGEARPTDAIDWEVLRQEAKSYVERIATELSAAGAVVEGRVAEGSAPREIRAISAHTAADLVVLSTHGDGADGAWQLGSTARKILELAATALLVVPSQCRCTRRAAVPPRRIFVPLDGSLRGETALPTAQRIARADGAELVVAHVVSEPIRSEVLHTESDLAVACELAARLAARADAYLEQVRLRIAANGPEVRKSLLRATDHRAGLVSLAENSDVDLVVLTAHGAVCDSKRAFGSVTAYFLAHSTVPVLVLQDLPRTEQASAKPSSRPPPRAADAGEPGK
jgi:nucleotide-binding universal stress UspA family protein